ncbi:MAG TPA: biotin--[acetyl-CoA-carboxylase] ligase [Candidatus Baltobacteraceae bacterium]|nr:biotin--[acetyl-CoA-carboxylase] ligase [Candidatus Baltobacteraceae bacterium]
MGRFDRISHVAMTGSTNDDMARMLGEERARGLALVADYQQQGAGRKGRSWLAPPGSALLCTIGLPDPLPASDLWVVPYWIAVVVRDALTQCGIDPVLQWPNDVLIGGRKAAGILCVSRVTGEYAWVGCGVGVNVRRPDDPHAIAGITPPPAYLSDGAPQIERDAVLHAMLRVADERYDELHSPARVTHAWESAAHLPGARYRILLDGQQEPFEATALRLLIGGALLVDHDGAQREITLADARVLRA